MGRTQSVLLHTSDAGERPEERIRRCKGYRSSGFRYVTFCPQGTQIYSIDEAHKASGGYAYTTILAYITAHHPFFRVLALTATPGADVPKVQGVVDALHISRIEIREAEAPEISKYMNEKVWFSPPEISGGWLI